MRIFNNYLGDFENILSRKVKVDSKLVETQRSYLENLQKGLLTKENVFEDTNISQTQGPKILFQYDKSPLEYLFGNNKSVFNEVCIGGHPDFQNLPMNGHLFHHCVSTFIDIKGSTKLISKYSLQEVRLIKDSLLTLAILIANQFGGHIHRLQGDGIFIQFVRKGRHANDAIINALNMTSILAYFVSNELAEIMEKADIIPIKIRVGIDFGSDENVLWSYYGLPGCTELTTTSLHTDMAAKLQGIAKNNSILIGDNIMHALDLRKEYIEYYQTNGEEERIYKITSDLTYPFFVFNWKKYLTTFPFFSNDSQKPNLITDNDGFSLNCIISNENRRDEEKYFPNSCSIEKGKNINFQLLENNYPYSMGLNDKISWKVSNSGKEAFDAGQSEHNFENQFDNLTKCNSIAAYLGHHLLFCELKRPNKQTVYLKYPIFVR